jgi:putative phosphoribosyl transferase
MPRKISHRRVFLHAVSQQHVQNAGFRRQAGGSRLALDSDMHRRFFLDRREAGRMLAHTLLPFKGQNPVVLALPRGGVPVGYEIARFLDATLDVFIVRKIGIPHHRELAMGALASGGIQVLDGDLIRRLRVPPHEVDEMIAAEMRELTRREERYGAGHAPPLLHGRIVILVDEGLATGFTMRAAVQAARKQQPARIVVAAPVGSSEAVRMVQAEADEVLCLRTPEPFVAVGLWYAAFEQTTDDEVRELLGRARDVERLAG